MDSSGGITAAQDEHVNPRCSPGRSDLSGLYHLGRTLGRGHFAVVKLARHVNTGQLVAVKMIDKTKLDVLATGHLLQEVRYEIQFILKGVEMIRIKKTNVLCSEIFSRSDLIGFQTDILILDHV